jgi:uncharacterized membrane protein
VATVTAELKHLIGTFLPILLVFAVPLSWLVAAAILEALGLPRGKAMWAGVIAGVATVGVIAGYVGTAFAGCSGEWTGSAQDEQWVGSPQEEFCTSTGSTAGLGWLPLLAVPTTLVLVSAFLWWKRRAPTLTALLFLLLCVTPLLPALYVLALPP